MLLVSLILIWGICWPVYKQGIPYAPPFMYVGLRVASGGLLLAVFLLPQRGNLRFTANWRAYAASALLNVVFTMGLQTIGMIYLPGGLISICVYIQPILLSVLAWLLLKERMTLLKISGLFVGFAGILIATVDSLKLQMSATGIGIALISAACWALGMVYVKYLGTRVDGFWMVAMQSLIGGVLLLAISVCLEEWSTASWKGPLWLSVGFGATFGIPVAFMIYYYLMNKGETGKVGSYTFLVPVVAVMLSAVFLNEPLTISLLIGLALVAASIYLVHLNRA